MIDDPTLIWRAPIGVLVLAILAARDRIRTGTWSRARELGFLFGVTGIAMLWAVAHDAITWSISPDYFVIGKDLPGAATSFAPVVPPALQAGWTAGLAIGLVLVVANNPLPDRPPLSYAILVRELARVALASALTALVAGAAAPFLATGFRVVLADAGVHDARSYLVVQGAHAGSYVGALVALPLAWRRIRCAR